LDSTSSPSALYQFLFPFNRYWGANMRFHKFDKRRRSVRRQELKRQEAIKYYKRLGYDDHEARAKAELHITYER
jgi:hypothetical protein